MFRVPILLHCSAGVGRTGTVIAIDRVMQWLNTKTLPRDFSVFNLIKELREARPKMCQVRFFFKNVDFVKISCFFFAGSDF